MAELLRFFGDALAASPAIALLAALVWGVMSVVLSPCHLSSIPLVVAYMNGGTELPTARRALGISTSFAFGILASIAAIGFVTAAAGRMLGDVGPAGNYVMAVVFFAVGLNLVGVLPLPSSFGGRSFRTGRRGALGALVLGLVFGAALGPCTFAFMAPILGVGFRAGSTAPGYAALLITLFGIGHAGIIVLAGSFAEGVQRWMNWKAGSRGASVVRFTAGVLVILAGAYFLYTAR
jgi:cytochrome c-type biogenesis protein